MEGIIETLPITLAVITRNEEANIARCLDSVPFAAEKLVVDCGSTDDTVAIAAAHGARVLHQDWLGFGAQRNFASAQAAHDWIVVLDADEFLSPELATELQRELPALMASGTACGSLRRRTWLMGAPMRWYKPMVGECQIRVYHRGRARWRDVRVHESLQFDGPVRNFAAPLNHADSPSLVHGQFKMLRYSELKALDWRERRRPVRMWLAPLVFAITFFKDYFLRLGFLDGWRGYMAAHLAANYALYKRLRHYEMQSNPASVDSAWQELHRRGLEPRAQHAPRSPAAAPRKLRVLHFVTGGFSGGATQVAIALVNAARTKADSIEPLLVLRHKHRGDPARIDELRAAGVPLRVVAGWSHLATIAGLMRVCREFRPDVLVAHGFSEHIWGRYAGLLAKVPVLIHVEHNTHERYTRWRLAQTRWLAKRTQRIVGCSEGVRQVLLDMGMPPERTIAIPNGIRLEPFADADVHPFAQRVPGIVMVARIAKQKDHATLLRAIALLRAKNLRPPLLIVGGSKPRYRAAMEKLARALGIGDQVQFLGIRRDVPELLMSHQIAALSTHYEGMPLALLEGMAAGCAPVASAVPGVREMLRDGVDGLLVPENDAQALADAFARILEDPAFGARLGAAARQRALAEHGRELMKQRYEELFLQLAQESRNR